MLTKDTQGNLFKVEKSDFHSNENYNIYFLTCLDKDLESLDTHISVFHDENLDDVLEIYDYDRHQKHVY